jgi:acyl-CoA thioesterase
MEEARKQALTKAVSGEPFARLMGIRLVEVGDGRALCEMEYGEGMDNMHGGAHDGAVFSLIGEAFEVSSNSHGTTAVALNMNVNYIKPARKGLLRAESVEVNRGRKTATYRITVEDGEGLVAVCQALASLKK